MLSAKQHWIMLRVSALVAVPLCVWLVYSIVDLAGADHAAFTAWLKNPLNAVLLIVTIVVNFYHAMLGCHEVIEDYIHGKALKNLSLAAKAAAFFIVGGVCVYSVIKIAFLN